MEIEQRILQKTRDLANIFLNPRAVEIIDLLVEQDKFVPLKFIADALKMSEQTVRIQLGKLQKLGIMIKWKGKGMYHEYKIHRNALGRADAVFSIVEQLKPMTGKTGNTGATGPGPKKQGSTGT